MIGQPSVNDLASVFKGNPGPLQARVNQDQQGQKPGTLPADLRDLLALQIVTNEQDAAKRSSAMQQLQQMQPQGQQGEPPTIAQSLQEQAKQKLQSQMVQQMQQQQGLQGLMQQLPPGPVPAQTPQPQEQPEAQGIDSLQSNMGESYAGGGIIAFSGEDDDQEVPKADEKYETPYDRRNRKLNESGHRFGDPKDLEGIKKALAFAGAPVAALGDVLALPVNAIRNLVRNPMDTSERPSLTPFMDARREFLNLPESAPAAPEPAPGARPTPAVDPRLLTTPQGQANAAAIRSGPPVGGPPPGPRMAAPAAPPAAPAAPAMSDRQKFLAAQFGQTPDAAAAEQEYETKVGQRSTSDLASLADELAARRMAARNRADPAMDFLRGIAMGPRGESWMQSGTRGGIYADEQRAAREAQDFEMLQKLVETKGKIADIEHGYKEKKYAAGKEGYKATYDRVLKAAELMGFDERQAREIAAKEAEGALDRENRLKVARIQADARMGGVGADSKEIQMAEAAFARDPEAAAIRKQLEGFTPAAKRPELLARLRAIQASKYRQFGLTLEGEAPGALGPGGTAPTGWGKAQVVK